VSDLVEQLTTQRAEDRIGDEVLVLVERVEQDECAGRAAHQGPEVDGECLLTGEAELMVGDLVRGKVVGAEGVDLIVAPVESVNRVDWP
jgi:tRNA A37 methylthiotransferase MiaB